MTDIVGVVGDDARLEATVDRIVARFGHQIAVVVISSTGGTDPSSYAAELGNRWGVGDASRDDGIVILVEVDDRVTQIETGPGVALSEGALDAIRSSGNAFFADGDFEGGILAMLSALEVRLESGNGDGVGTDAGEEFSQEEAPAADDGSSTGLVMLGIIGVAGGATAVVVRQRSENRRRERRRRDQVDSLLARLDVSGHEMPQLVEFALPAPAAGGAVTTGDGLLALAAVSGGERTEDVASVEALWAEGMIAVIDATALDASTEVPLELAASGEGDVLEESVQASARAALRIDIGDRASFDVAAGELHALSTRFVRTGWPQHGGERENRSLLRPPTRRSGLLYSASVGNGSCVPARQWTKTRAWQPRWPSWTRRMTRPEPRLIGCPPYMTSFRLRPRGPQSPPHWRMSMRTPPWPLPGTRRSVPS